MDTSVVLARIIGPYMLIAGTGLIVNRADYQGLLAKLPKQRLLLLVMGVFTLILGLLLLQFHNIWVLDWRVALTLIGWLMVIKGALALIAPATLLRMANAFGTNQKAISLQGILALLFGAFISYMGYFA